MTKETATYIPLYGLYQRLQSDFTLQKTHAISVKKEKKSIVMNLSPKKKTAV